MCNSQCKCYVPLCGRQWKASTLQQSSAEEIMRQEKWSCTNCIKFRSSFKPSDTMYAIGLKGNPWPRVPFGGSNNLLQKAYYSINIMREHVSLVNKLKFSWEVWASLYLHQILYLTIHADLYRILFMKIIKFIGILYDT